MKLKYRQLTEQKLDEFIEMRIAQLREEGATEQIDIKPNLRDYYHRHMSDGTFVSWLAFDDVKIVGTSGMSFVEKPPYFSCPSGKIGLLSSMYTHPDYRRNGIATELLDRVVNEARQYGCGTIQITAAFNPPLQLFTTVLKNPLPPPTFAYFLQDTILHTQAAHLLPEHLRHIQSREWFSNLLLLCCSLSARSNLHRYIRQCCYGGYCMLRKSYSFYLSSFH